MSISTLLDRARQNRLVALRRRAMRIAVPVQPLLLVKSARSDAANRDHMPVLSRPNVVRLHLALAG